MLKDKYGIELICLKCKKELKDISYQYQCDRVICLPCSEIKLSDEDLEIFNSKKNSQYKFITKKQVLDYEKLSKEEIIYKLKLKFVL